jgi:hypothetical protein
VISINIQGVIRFVSNNGISLLTLQLSIKSEANVSGNAKLCTYITKVYTC